MTTTRGRGGIALLLGGVALAAAIGAAGGSIGNDGPNGPPNTVGRGAHARVMSALAGAAAANLSATARDLLASAGATRAVSVARLGTGSHAAELFSVTLPGGRNCLTVSHAAGRIVEPLNCASDAYLRVWSDASGNGDPDIAKATSMRLVAVVASEVDAVRISFADGSAQTLTPDANGVVALEADGGAALPVQVEVLAADGSSFGSVNV